MPPRSRHAEPIPGNKFMGNRSGHWTIVKGGQTRQSTARNQFNASDFLDYWCGLLFRNLCHR